MHIEADQNKCVGAGQCVMAAPELFDQRDSDGIVEVLVPDPADSQAAQAREAELTCPAAAITVTAT
ncbi:ferredoxin [Pseudonocardia sp. WMMC193]|uniref:ferredoxin n=1 Tax=Pseudonocardia sp. WMMC193 TaxID=2911965 RepID=UPI001F3BFEC5|nr:ferredoxin [Pseudonocardia sp. WMMC193]MCF7550564.1 ferredoxin [Pseudonocardia sp. WMMC193]